MQSKSEQYNVIDQKDKDLVFGYTRIWCKNLNSSRIPDVINHLYLSYYYEHDKFNKTSIYHHNIELNEQTIFQKTSIKSTTYLAALPPYNFMTEKTMLDHCW